MKYATSTGLKEFGRSPLEKMRDNARQRQWQDYYNDARMAGDSDIAAARYADERMEEK